MAELNWVDKNERLPTESDANESMLYGVTVDGNVMNVHITHFTTMNKHFTHWLPYSEMPVPKRWRVPTIHDLAKGSISCRFRMDDEREWKTGALAAIDVREQASLPFFCQRLMAVDWYAQCEICDA